MRISEVFYTLQGEGMNIGKPAIFVRTSGCNLRCHWCDTMFASWHPEGGHFKPTQVADMIEDARPGSVKPRRIEVVISGGEPMIYAKELRHLVAMLRTDGYGVTIETAGTIYDSMVRPSLWSISPKLAHSAPDQTEHPNEYRKHMKNNKFQAEFTKRANTQYKFVVRHDNFETDLEEVRKFKKYHGIATRDIILMPEGQTHEETIAAMPYLFEKCMQYGYTMAPRLHVILYGSKRGV